MIIEYESADSTLEKLNSTSSDHYYWEGWTICKFSPNKSAAYDKDGAYNDPLGWGYLTKYEVNEDGSWNLDR